MPSGEDYRYAGRGNWLRRDDYIGRILGANSIFRLQTHQQYLVPAERDSFERFLSTGESQLDDDDRVGLTQLRDSIEAGNKFQRVQIVVPPVSDYLRYARKYYHYSAETGEDLRILDTSVSGTGGLPNYDFIMLDEQAIIKIHYEREEGVLIGPELLPHADVDQYIRFRDIAVERSIPFLEYEKVNMT